MATEVLSYQLKGVGTVTNLAIFLVNVIKMEVFFVTHVVRKIQLDVNMISAE